MSRVSRLLNPIRFLVTLLPFLLAAPASQAATFEFWHALGGKAGEFVSAQCKRYNESQSAHQVTCVFQGSYDDLFQKTIAAYRARKQPALVQIFDAGTLDMLLSNAIVPVEELARATRQTAGLNDFLPAVSQFYAIDGRLQGQPYNTSTLLFYTNDSMLAKAGVASPPSTWEDVAATAEKLKSAGVVCPLVLDLNPWRILEQFSAVEGEPIATLGNGFHGLKASYVFNSGANVRFIDDLARWHRDGLARLPEETKAGKYTPAFDSGECAMILNSSGAYADTKAAIGRQDKITAHLMPIFAGARRHNTIVGGGALYALKGFDDTTEAGVADFLAFVRTPREIIAMTAATGYLPTTETAVHALQDSPAVATDVADVARLGVASLAEPGTDDTQGTRLGFLVRFRAIYTEEVSKVLAGTVTAQQALDTAKRRGDELLRRFEQTYAAPK